MDRREFSKMVTLGSVGMTLGAAAQTARAAGDSTVSQSGHKAWARETWKGFENIVMASFRGDDLSELDEEGIRLDIRQSIAHGFFSSLIEASAAHFQARFALTSILAWKGHSALVNGGRQDGEAIEPVSVGRSLGTGARHGARR